MRHLWFGLIASLILNGCAHTHSHREPPAKQVPETVALASIKTIGVIPAAIQTYDKRLSIHETLLLKSMVDGAAAGASTGFDINHPIGLLFAPVFALTGGVSGATNPKQVPVMATIQQNRVTDRVFAEGIKSVTYNTHRLQRFLVDDGNRLTSYLFTPVNGPKRKGNQNAGYIKDNRLDVDAHIRPSDFQIALIGEQANDPNLTLIVNGHFTLSKSGYPDTCLGWYSSTWKGSTRNLSAWHKNDAESLKQELIAALAVQSNEAITFLFNSEETRISHGKTCSDYPDWANCYEARHQKITDYVKWYCPGADRGFAESQRYIGDLYYESGITEGAVNSFVWYSLAAAGDDREAANRLSQVRQQLSPAQLNRAENRLRQYKPGNCESELTSIQ